MIQFLIFIFGASLGSFINVLSLRYNPDKNFWTLFRLRNKETKKDRDTAGLNRSQCPGCGKVLPWFELIPIVSYLIQRGRCRSCHQKLSWQYPIVEALMGILAVVVYTSVFTPLFTPPMCKLQCVTLYLFLLLLLSTLICLALIDLRTTIIPDELIVGSLVLVTLTHFLTFSLAPNSFLSLISFNSFYSFNSLPPLTHLALGALIGGGFLTALWLAGRGTWMGLGDGKLGAVLGLWLGFPGVLLALALSFVSGTIVASGLLATKQKTLKDTIPFGPFLVIGGISAFFLHSWWQGWWRVWGI